MAGNPEHLLVLALARLFNEIFELAGQHFEFGLELVVLRAEFADDHLFFVALDRVFIHRAVLYEVRVWPHGSPHQLLLDHRDDAFNISCVVL